MTISILFEHLQIEDDSIDSANLSLELCQVFTVIQLYYSSFYTLYTVNE